MCRQSVINLLLNTPRKYTKKWVSRINISSFWTEYNTQEIIKSNILPKICLFLFSCCLRRGSFSLVVVTILLFLVHLKQKRIIYHYINIRNTLRLKLNLNSLSLCRSRKIYLHLNLLSATFCSYYYSFKFYSIFSENGNINYNAYIEYI